MSAEPKKTGRPLKSTEPMKPRRIRMTDAQWSDAVFITPDRVRELVTDDAAAIRAAAAKAAKQRTKGTK